MALHKQKVTKVHHWTDKTFSFQVERPASFRFRSGEFVTIGLEVLHRQRGKIIWNFSALK
jgi:ferredoxin--NADP+ reductase